MKLYEFNTFGRTIRVNHYMGDEKRGFYYDDE